MPPRPDAGDGRKEATQPLWAQRVEARFLEFEPRMTWYQLSGKVGISQGRLSEWNHGRGAPDWKQIQAIADAIEVPVGYLTREDGGPVAFPVLADDEKLLVQAARTVGVLEILKIVFAAAVGKAPPEPQNAKRPDGPVEFGPVRSREGGKSSEDDPGFAVKPKKKPGPKKPGGPSA